MTWQSAPCLFRACLQQPVKPINREVLRIVGTLTIADSSKDTQSLAQALLLAASQEASIMALQLGLSLLEIITQGSIGDCDEVFAQQVSRQRKETSCNAAQSPE